MEKKNTNIIFSICIGIIIIISIVGLIYIETNKDNNIQSTNGEIKEKTQIKDEDIIEFAKEEIKKKLRYPETAIFQKEEILGKEDNKIVVSMYSVSENKNHEESRTHFVLGIKNNKGILEIFNIATNEDTCNADVAEEFEELMKNCNYEKVYNELFTLNLKNSLSIEKFKSYQINMYAQQNVSANLLADGSILTSFYDSVNKKGYLVTIKNGMITQLKQV